MTLWPPGELRLFTCWPSLQPGPRPAAGSARGAHGMRDASFSLLIRLDDRILKYLLRRYFWVCFRMKLKFESVDSGKRIALLSVGGHHLIR